MSKITLFPFYLLLIVFCLAACTDSENNSSKSNEPENQVLPIEKDEDKTAPVKTENPAKLTETEIREIMDNFQKIEDIVFTTNSKMTFSMEERMKPEVMSAELLKNLPDSIQELASTEMINKVLPEMINYWYATSGEDGFFPNISLDVRMEVIENTPIQIKVKTFQLDESYMQRHGNVYITAINENGKWLIDDGYEWVDVDKEPLNLSKEEILLYEENITVSGIEFIAEETITSATDNGQSITANAIIIKIVKDNILKARFTDTGKIAVDIPGKFGSIEQN